MFSRSETYHTSRLYSLGHTPGIGLTPEHVTVKMMPACVHDEGEGVHIVPDAHEGKEAHTTLHQHFFFILVRNIVRN